MKLKIDIPLNGLTVNRVVRYLILSDFLLFGGWGFMAPLFGVFVIARITGATLVTLGAAAAIYWIGKSVVQIPVSIYLDRREGERDEFKALILSLMLAGFTAIAFLLARTVGQFYLVTLLQAIAFGFYTPSWSALFSRHLDRGHYSFDWSLDSTSVGIAAGITGLLGGTLANFFGFSVVFILGSALSFIGAFVLLAVPDLVLPRATSAAPVIRDHAPTTANK